MQIDKNDASQNYMQYVTKTESHTNVLKNLWTFLNESTQYTTIILSKRLVLWPQISKVCL